VGPAAVLQDKRVRGFKGDRRKCGKQSEQRESLRGFLGEDKKGRKEGVGKKRGERGRSDRCHVAVKPQKLWAIIGWLKSGGRSILVATKGDKGGFKWGRKRTYNTPPNVQGLYNERRKSH